MPKSSFTFRHHTCERQPTTTDGDGGLQRARSSELDLLGARSSSLSSRPSGLSLRTVSATMCVVGCSGAGHPYLHPSTSRPNKQPPKIQSGGTWDEDDEGDEEEEEEQEQEEAGGGGGEGLWLDDDNEEEEEAAAAEGVISVEEEGNGSKGKGYTGGLAPSTEGGDDVLSRPVPSWREPRSPISLEEYAATVIIETACLSIDRRPNNQGLELSVASESLVVLDEAPALRVAKEPVAATAAGAGAPLPAPVKVSTDISNPVRSMVSDPLSHTHP
jgi:hypothetical protein